MMIGIPNPIVGGGPIMRSASHVSYTGLPGPAHTVVINPNNNQTVLYDLQFGGNCGATPTYTDFNHDAKPDYVLYNASTHQTAVWYMNDTVFLIGAYYPTLPAGWNVIDVGGFQW